MTNPPEEEAARWRKVACMLAASIALGITSDEALALNVTQWRTVADKFGFKPPSQTTVDWLHTTLKEARERWPQK